MARSSTPKLEKSISLPDSGSKRLTSRRQVAVIRRSLAAAVKEQEEEAVNAILAEIGEALNCRTGVLRVIDKLPNEANTLRAYATYNFDLSDWKKKSAYLDLDIRSPMTQAFLDQKVIEFSDIQQENPRLHMNWAWIERYDLHSAIYLPVGSSRGVLSLYRSEIKPFSKGEIIFCEELADVLALAIDKSNAEQRYRKLREMSDALSNLTELDDILREACIHIRPLLGVELGSIFLKTRQIEGDEDREYLIRAELSAEDIPDNWFPNERYKIGQGVIGRALNERNDIVVENNVSQSTKVVRATVRQYNRILKTGRCVHVAAAPLIGHDGSQLGVIRVMNKLDNHSGVIRRGFAESDIEILRTLTSVIADAIDDAQLRDKLRNIGQSTKIISLQNDQSTKTLEENFRELLINIQQVARHLKLADEVGAVAILPDHHRLTGIVDFAFVFM